jgi:hypothetical protein
MLITVVVVAFFAFITGIPISRLGGSEAAIATLALLAISGSILVGARDEGYPAVVIAQALARNLATVQKKQDALSFRPKSRATWSDGDHSYLAQMILKGVMHKDIAKTMGRSTKAISAKVYMLKVSGQKDKIDAEQRLRANEMRMEAQREVEERRPETVSEPKDLPPPKPIKVTATIDAVPAYLTGQTTEPIEQPAKKSNRLKWLAVAAAVAMLATYAIGQNQ